MSPEQRLNAERWLAWVRLGAVPFVILEAAAAAPYPPGRAGWVWATAIVFAVGGVAFFVLSRRRLSPAALGRVGLAALIFDFVVISSFILSLYYQPTVPIRQVMILVLVEAAFRYGMRGGFVLALLSIPVLTGFEWLRDDYLDQRYRWEIVLVQVGIEVVIVLLVGWLVERLRAEASIAQDRVHEAEYLQDELDRRGHVLDAANRCARALGSSLELEEAFGAFIQELNGLVPFDRTAIILSDEGQIRVMATAGLKHDEVLQPGASLPTGALVEEVLRTGETVYRRDMRDHLYPEEVTLTAIGLRSRIAAPLLLGERPIGMLAILRRKPRAFDDDEIELASLLGRLLASGVQNIRAYESERATVAELRRLSALRADFVSLVSHELRSPMAAVIGAARTLEERWRELTATQRTAFLALIADETNRLAALIGDVLDTSRIEAGTFSYRFGDVDVAELVRDTVAGFALHQEEVTVVAHVDRQVPKVSGDRERLRQVLQNLLENAVKYSRTGEEVDVRAWAENGRVLVAVEDTGPGIPREQHALIFERFGRANVGLGKPGTGLGLFIARSIAEAHGGRLTVDSSPGDGATFTLNLPASTAGQGPPVREGRPAAPRSGHEPADGH
jgi:signal transduction histidine kinase